MSKFNCTMNGVTSKDKQDFQKFKVELAHFIPADSLVADPHIISKKLKNTLGVVRESPLIVYPSNVSDVQKIVMLANHFSVPLYPLSRGHNIGYGDWAPSKDGCTVVSLEKLNKVIEFDEELGEIEIQPGVSQWDLFSFLENSKSGWTADMTGAPPEASVLGNILEGGFGHSAFGNRREHILDLEVVLGNGQILRTGQFPDVGPNLSSLFVQSNFAIVTAVRIPLMKASSYAINYVLRIENDRSLLDLISRLRELRQNGLLSNLLHIANAPRVLMSSQRFPESLSSTQVLSEDDCLELLKVPFLDVSRWMAVGAIYGTPGQIKHTKREIKKALKHVAKISFYTQKRIQFYKKLVKLVGVFSKDSCRKIDASLSSLESLHGLCLGRPSDKPSKNVLWRCKNREDLGLLWISPVVIAKKQAIEKLLQLVRPIFFKFQFEMPITFTYINRSHFVCVLNINFNKRDQEESDRASKAYDEIISVLSTNGIRLYRKSIRSQAKSLPEDRRKSILLIKNAWDPNGIIAPGRYGIEE